MACFKGKMKVNCSGPTPHVQNLIINLLSSSTVAFFFWSACQYDVPSRVRDFQNGDQSVRIKISILSRKYSSDFLDLEILRSLLS